MALGQLLVCMLILCTLSTGVCLGYLSFFNVSGGSGGVSRMWPPGHRAWGPGEGLAVSRQKASSGCPLALDTFWPSPPIEVQGIKEGFSSEGQIHFDSGFPTLCPLVCHCMYQVPGHSKCLALFSRVKESQGLYYVQVGKVVEVPSQVP